MFSQEKIARQKNQPTLRPVSRKYSGLRADRDSFRDRSNRIYTDGARIVRGLDASVNEAYRELSHTQFFQDFTREGKIVATTLIDRPPDKALEAWDSFLQHEKIPFISYPYASGHSAC